MINPYKIHWRGRWDSNPRMDGFRDRRLNPLATPQHYKTQYTLLFYYYIFAVSVFIL